MHPKPHEPKHNYQASNHQKPSQTTTPQKNSHLLSYDLRRCCCRRCRRTNPGRAWYSHTGRRTDKKFRKEKRKKKKARAAIKAKSPRTPAMGHEIQRREDEWKTEEKIVTIKARIHVFRQGILTRKRKTGKRKATPVCVCVCGAAVSLSGGREKRAENATEPRNPTSL